MKECTKEKCAENKCTDLEQIVCIALHLIQEVDEEGEDVHRMYTLYVTTGYPYQYLSRFQIDRNALWEVLRYVYYTWIKNREEGHERTSEKMTVLEHLTENALIAMQKADESGESTYEAFLETMKTGYGHEALGMYSIDENVLWEILQYVYYTWIKERDDDK